ELHGGTVQAHSGGPGQGSEFVVHIPLAEVCRSEPKEPRHPQERPVLTLTPGRILVVDDNRDAANSLRLLLSRLGMQVHVAYDGPAALAALNTHGPAVVLLDI